MTRSANPLYTQFISQPLETATTIGKKKTQVLSGFEFSNIFEYAPKVAGVGLDIDMESWRFPIKITRGLSKNTEVGLALSLMHSGGGFLDSFIQNYHNAFGFPNGGRDRVSNGRYAFNITRNGASIYSVNAHSLINNDATLFGKWLSFEETKTRPAIALKGALKIPLTTADSGAGSLRPDVGLSFLIQKSMRRVHSYSQIGFAALGGHEKINSLIKKGAWVYAQGFEFNLANQVSLLAQINGQSSHFKSTGIASLDEGLLDLTVGLKGFILAEKKKWIYEVGLTEDPTGSGPSVDFTFFGHVGLEF